MKKQQNIEIIDYFNILLSDQTFQPDFIIRSGLYCFNRCLCTLRSQLRDTCSKMVLQDR